MTLARDSALLTGAQVYYKITGFFVYPLLAASLPAADIGLFFYAVSTAQLLLVIAGANAAPLVVRRLRSGASLPEQLSSFVFFRMTAAPLFLAACAGAAYVLRPSAALPMLAAATFVLLEDVYAAAAALLIARDRTSVVVKIGVTVQTLYFASLWGGLTVQPALSTVFLAQLVRTAALVILGALALSRLAPLRPHRRPGFLDGVAPFALLAAAAALFNEIDALVLGGLTALDEVARYGLAQKAVAGTFFFPTVLGTVYYARHAARGDRKTLTVLLALVFATAGAGTAIAALGAGPIGRFLFPDHPGVVGVLAALSPCILLGSLAILLSVAAQAEGRERGALVALLVGAVVGIAGDAVLVPSHGAVGAAWARAAGTLVQVAVLAAVLLRPVPSKAP